MPGEKLVREGVKQNALSREGRQQKYSSLGPVGMMHDERLVKLGHFVNGRKRILLVFLKGQFLTSSFHGDNSVITW